MRATNHRLLPIALLLTVLTVGMLAMIGCVEAEDPEDEKTPIVFSDRQWQTKWIINSIAQFIVEEGYGYPTQTETLSTPALQAAMETGDVDVDVELWRMNMLDWYEEITEEGTMIDVGPVFDTSKQAWYVPRYVIEGDEERGIEPMAPDLESVFDLPDYWEVFEDPEEPGRGRFINGIAGWEVTEVNTVKIQVYGLDEHYNVVEPGSAGALDSAIAGAYEAGEPILAYYWEPTWLLGKYDMVPLEEPEYDPEIRAQLDKVVDGELSVDEVDAACAFQEFAIHSGVHESLKERAPEVVEFLGEMNVGTEPLNEASAYIESEGVEAEDAAMWYFENYEERWRDWLPEDVEQRVEEALLEEGVDLGG